MSQEIWVRLKPHDFFFIHISDHFEEKLKSSKCTFFIISGLSLFTLVIVCVAEPNVEETITSDTVNTETREGKSKF